MGIAGARKERSAQEQQRIVEMYRTTIKMSSENKLNEKNAWQIHFIDTMSEALDLEEEEIIPESQDTAPTHDASNKSSPRKRRGVNFQRASIALDASVKIYSIRVDDTHKTSHRILENLSRGSRGREEANENDDPAPRC